MEIPGLIDTFKELVAIDSPSFGERMMCDHLIKRLDMLGVTAFEDNAGDIIGGNAGNLYAYIEGNPELEPLLFCTHMDTVEPSKGKSAVIRDDGLITSAGDTVLGADDMSGVTAILEALRRIKENQINHRPIELLFTVAEEVYGKGAAVFDYSKIKSKEAYVPDLEGSTGLAAYKAPTILSFTVTVTGKASHAGFAPQDGIHAILAAVKAINHIKMGRVDGKTTCNIGIIEGGAAPNIVPAVCVVKGEIRSWSHSGALTHMEAVTREFKNAAASVGAVAEAIFSCDIEAYETPLSHNVVKRFETACTSLGIPSSLQPTFGGSDNNHLAKHGITGIVIASEMRRCHSPDEYTTVDGLNTLTDLIYTLMTMES